MARGVTPTMGGRAESMAWGVTPTVGGGAGSMARGVMLIVGGARVAHSGPWARSMALSRVRTPLDALSPFSSNQYTVRAGWAGTTLQTSD